MATQIINQHDTPIDTMVSLQHANTLSVPCVAQYYCYINNTQRLQALCRKNDLPKQQWILGGGSNTVLTDNVPGLLWHVGIKGYHQIHESAQHIDVAVGAGENWHQWVQYTIEQNWFGLENLIGIPGLVGAAPIQNIGAYGAEVSQTLLWVEAIELATGEKKRLNNKDCDFSYRSSIFKTKAMQHKWLITQVAFRLQKQPNFCLDYAGIKAQLTQPDQPTQQAIAKAIMHLRQRKLPDPTTCPNAGSFFKNPCIHADVANRLKKQHPNLPLYPYQKGYKLSAAWLIDQCGLKGKMINGISMSKQHALILTNTQQKTGKEIIQFATYIKQQVHKQFAIHLDNEVQFIPK